MTETEANKEESPRRRGRRGAASGQDDAGSAAAETEAAAPLSIGATLRAAREAAGLTLADVAAKTKVRPGILSEIEADDHDRLPALTYTLGFVKAYARTVDIDPEEAGRRYREESHKGDPISTIEDLQPLDEQRRPSRRLVWLSALLLLLALVGFWAWGAGWLTPVNPARPDAAATAPPAADTLSDAVTIGAEEDENGVAAPDTVSADATAGSAVVLAARDEVWLRVSDGQEIFFTGILQPGQTLDLPAGRGWKLRTGRAGAIEVKIGNRILPPLGGAVEQLHDVSLAPADLLARFSVP